MVFYTYLLTVMGDYKIKTEDKAPFINLLKAKDVKVDSYEITDDKSKPYFEFKTEDPRTEEIVKSILKTNKKINQIKEMGKLTRSQLAEIIREELASAKKGKKKETLKEYLQGQEAVMDFGNWAIENGPAFVKTFGKDAYEIGSNLIGLLTAGSIVLTGTTAAFINKLKSKWKAAKSGGGDDSLEEAEGDDELLDIFAKIKK